MYPCLHQQSTAADSVEKQKTPCGPYVWKGRTSRLSMFEFDLIYVDDVVMVDNHVRGSYVSLNTSLSRKMTMLFLQKEISYRLRRISKWSQKWERETSSPTDTDCQCEASIVDN